MSIKILNTIPGITVRAFPLSEAIIKCNITLSFSDAKDLCLKTKSGLPKNKKLRDLFFDVLSEELQRVTQIKENKIQ